MTAEGTLPSATLLMHSAPPRGNLDLGLFFSFLGWMLDTHSSLSCHTRYCSGVFLHFPAVLLSFS